VTSVAAASRVVHMSLVLAPIVVGTPTERYLENIKYGFLGSGQVPRERMLRY
jgi:hypothetical protein